MPDTRSHRGAHPDDPELFADDQLPALRRAVADLSHLRSRGYGENSALELVGDRYRLRRRQRTALLRAACSDESLRLRRSGRATLEECAGEPVAIDGFNLLITLESALGDAFLIRGRDGCCRDLGGLHGTYRRVEETQPALNLAAEHLGRSEVSEVRWFLDRPVSNCKRAAGWIREIGRSARAAWRIELVAHVDDVLLDGEAVVATTDAPVLDAVDRWVDLAGRIVDESIPEARIVDLSPD